MSGARGKLSVKFREKADGKTYVGSQYYKLPLQIMPAFYQDDDGTAFVYMLNPSGGVLQNDVLSTDIQVEKDAKALITTPGSNKFYKMTEGHASIKNTFNVGQNGILEYLPEHNVPFAMSKVFQETEINLHETSKMIAFDIITSGRVARGETFQYELYSSKLKITVGGKLKVYEYGRLEPLKSDLSGMGILEGYNVNASVYFYSKELKDSTIEKLNGIFCETNWIKCGASLVSQGLGIVRILGNGIMDVQDMILKVWSVLRADMLGKNIVKIRRY